MLEVVPWAIAVPLVYLAWQKAWPLIVAHAVYDMVAFGVFGTRLMGPIVRALVLAGVVLVVVGVLQIRRSGGSGAEPAGDLL